MEGPSRYRVDLHAVDENGQRLLAIDLEIDQRVGSGASAEQLELMSVKLNWVGLEAMAVDHRRQQPVPAESCDALAGHIAVYGGKGRTFGWHRARTSSLGATTCRHRL